MMSRTGSRIVFRICCIASVLILMLSLCGCRTRLSNNDEVASVVYDEDVFMSAEYQLRRDELGLDKAKKPFFNGFSSPEEPEEDYDDYDVGRLEDYDPAEEEEEPEIITPDDTPKKSKAGGGGSALSRSDEDEGDSDPEPQEIVVKLDPNGGECEQDTILVVIGEAYGDLPVATREGYDFLGWYTTKGKKVGSETVVRATKDHSLFAQWKEKNKPVYTVIFDLNGDGAKFTSGEATATIPEGGKYGELPVAERSGYLFEGWFTAAEGGSKIEAGADFKANANQTLYAHWKEDPYSYWEERLAVTVSELDKEGKLAICNIPDADAELEALISECGGKIATDGDPIQFKIKHTSDMSQAEDLADDVDVIVISDEIKTTKDQNKKLYMQLLLLSNLQSLDLESAKVELKITDEDDSLVKIVKKKASEPETPPDEETPPESESQDQP